MDPLVELNTAITSGAIERPIWSFACEGPAHHLSWRAAADIGEGEQLVGEGASKTEARRAVAKQILSKMVDSERDIRVLVDRLKDVAERCKAHLNEEQRSALETVLIQLQK
jgi:hypothetical protein